MKKYNLQDDSGLALVMSIMFMLIISGLAITLYSTTYEDTTSSISQVTSADCFNTAEAGLNIGMARIKNILETYNSIDVGSVFTSTPFSMSSEDAGMLEVDIEDFGYFDLVAVSPLPPSKVSEINNYYVDVLFGIHNRSIDGFFKPETSNPDDFGAYLSGAEPIYSLLIDVGESTYLRGWRIYLLNDNDGNDNTALLVSVGYILDPANDVLYSKKIQAQIYAQSDIDEKDLDMTNQVTGSETGSRTGKFRVQIDGNTVVESTSVR